MSMKLTDSKKGLVVKMLAEKPLYETGLEFGFDKHYKDSQAVKNAVYRILQQAKKDPEKFLLTQETLDLVDNVMKSRNVAPPDKSLREKQDEAANVDMKDLVANNSKKAMKLLGRKMDLIASSKKKLDSVSISALAQTAGIMFDKRQILKGEATEHVAVLGKIESDIDPVKALDLVLKMRENHQAEKEKVK